MDSAPLNLFGMFLLLWGHHFLEGVHHVHQKPFSPRSRSVDILVSFWGCGRDEMFAQWHSNREEEWNDVVQDCCGPKHVTQQNNGVHGGSLQCLFHDPWRLGALNVVETVRTRSEKLSSYFKPLALGGNKFSPTCWPIFFTMNYFRKW